MYIDTETNIIYSEAQYEKYCELVENGDRFNEWLKNHFAPIEIWDLTSSEREKALNDWRTECKQEALSED